MTCPPHNRNPKLFRALIWRNGKSWIDKVCDANLADVTVKTLMNQLVSDCASPGSNCLACPNDALLDVKYPCTWDFRNTEFCGIVSCVWEILDFVENWCPRI